MVDTVSTDTAAGAPRCPVSGHSQEAGYRVVKNGLRPGRDGWQQRYRCIAPDDTRHLFTTPEVVMQRLNTPADARRRHHINCPKPSHADGTVRFRGTRVSKSGTWQRFQCVRPGGAKHYFQVLASADGSALISLTLPPACVEHPRGKVVRNGPYLTRGNPRQSYRCEPANGQIHWFSLPLPRDTVDVGTSACTTCDELLSPHRGTLTAARRTPWTLKAVAKALNDLSLGESYAAVSMALRAQRDKAADHLRDEHGEDGKPIRRAKSRAKAKPAANAGVTRSANLPSATSVSYIRQHGRNSWHLAADIAEQYSPLLFARAQADVTKREQALRAANDAELAKNPDAILNKPIVYVLDELPVVVSRRRHNDPKKRTQQNNWYLLVVIELIWHPTDDPMAATPKESRLRLVRAYPRASAQTWRLVLDEIGTRPDYIVADTGSAISSAVNEHYGAGVVGRIPSFFHIHRNIRDALLELSNATTMLEGRKTLVHPLSKHLDLLRRGDVVSMTDQRWADWWVELIAEVAALPAPTAGISAQRTVYKELVADALPMLRKNGELPASNADVEVAIRETLKPFLRNRQHLYRNLARTNALWDLAVCRSQGAFGDLDEVAAVIRASNEANGGWAPLARAVTDTQPRRVEDDGTGSGTTKVVKLTYSSLLNPFLVSRLAKSRGLNT